MVIRVQHHKNISKQTLLNDVDFDPPKWHICGTGLKRSVHECMNEISNEAVHERIALKCKYSVNNRCALIGARVLIRS